MSSSPEPPLESKQQGISLDELAAAFAQVMGVEPRRPDDGRPDETDSASLAAAVSSAGSEGAAEAAAQTTGQAMEAVADDQPVGTDDDAACPISPRNIFEAMLFVGNRDNRPLSAARAAELMRGVQPDEVPVLVDELNRCYAANGRPYEIVGEADGYRLILRREHHPLRNRFYGRVREAKLSQAAIDVLALVAYQQPITGEQISRLRSKPSSHILAHLVRRGLLRIERPDPKRRTAHYHTTDRFLRLFNLRSLEDLPRSEDPGPM